MGEARKEQKAAKLTREELATRNDILKELEASGELNRIQSNLYAQLILNEGWGQAMQQQVRDSVQQSGGIAEITLDELVANLTKEGKSRVPESIKADTLEQIKVARSKTVE